MAIGGNLAYSDANVVKLAERGGRRVVVCSLWWQRRWVSVVFVGGGAWCAAKLVRTKARTSRGEAFHPTYLLLLASNIGKKPKTNYIHPMPQQDF